MSGGRWLMTLFGSSVLMKLWTAVVCRVFSFCLTVDVLSLVRAAVECLV